MSELINTLTDKQRIVFAGSEGAEFISSVCSHVLRHLGRPFDLIINGSAVTSSSESPLALIVASESIHHYGQPDFLTYKHHIGVIPVIQFKENNGFSSEDAYIRQYDQFADATPKGGVLVFSEMDPVASVLCNKERPDVTYLPFKSHPHSEENGNHYLTNAQRERVPIQLRSRKDLLWFAAAREILKRLGVTPEQFFVAITSFQPA